MQTIKVSYISSAVYRVHNRNRNCLVETDLTTDPRDARITDHHNSRGVVRGEQFDKEIICANRKLDLQLEVDLTTYVHDGGVVVRASLNEVECYVGHRSYRLWKHINYEKRYQISFSKA